MEGGQLPCLLLRFFLGACMVFLVEGLDHRCGYHNANAGITYDLSALVSKSMTFTEISTETQYVANVCAPISSVSVPAVSTCLGGQHPLDPTIAQIDAHMNCFVLGTLGDGGTSGTLGETLGAPMRAGGTTNDEERASSATGRWSLIDPTRPHAGVQVEYDGGDVCRGTPGRPRRRTAMVFQCAAHRRRTQIIRVTEAPTCVYEIVIRSPHACPVSSGLCGGSLFILLGLVAAFVYVGAGVTYNTKMHGKSGMEAFPQIERWQECWALVQEGCAFTREKVSGLTLSFRQSGYDPVTQQPANTASPPTGLQGACGDAL